MFEIAIAKKYRSLTDSGSNLGIPLGPIKLLGKEGKLGAFQDFTNGSIYVSQHTAAHLITGIIRDEWRRQGAYESKLGFPTSDEIDSRSGNGSRQSNFEHGIILWKHNAQFATALTGDFLNKYNQLDADAGPLGFPTRREFSFSSSEQQMSFENGIIWRTDRHGANAVFARQICVTNDTAFDANIRFYNPQDLALPPFSAPLQGGEIFVAANSSYWWELPAGIDIAKAVFDGNYYANSVQISEGGRHLTFNQEQRVTVINEAGIQGTVRFYDPSGISLAPLDNGVMPIGAHQTLMWRMPEHLIDVHITFNHLGEQFIHRGGVAIFNIDDRIYLHNNTSGTVRFLLFKQTEPNLTLELPGGNILVPAGQQAAYIVPLDVAHVMVIRNVLPLGLGDDRLTNTNRINFVVRGHHVSFP